jgi:hypothetical protein
LEFIVSFQNVGTEKIKVYFRERAITGISLDGQGGCPRKIFMSFKITIPGLNKKAKLLFYKRKSFAPI